MTSIKMQTSGLPLSASISRCSSSLIHPDILYVRVVISWLTRAGSYGRRTDAQPESFVAFQT